MPRRNRPLPSASIFARFKVLARDSGSQIFEFALVLPFLIVFLVGIIDFGTAFHLKQRLNNAAREGARYAAWQSMLDVNCGGSCTPAPTSIRNVRDTVANYLAAANVANCAVGTTATYSASPYPAWTYTSPTAGCSTFSLEIDRNYTVTGYTYVGLNGNTVPVTANRVVIHYPYNWLLFGGAIGLLAPGANYGTSVTLTTDAIVEQN